MNLQLPYEFMDHTADIGVRIYGATLEELFQNAAKALYETLGRFAVKGEGVKREIKIEDAGGGEELLVEWLSELLFRFDAHGELYDRIDFDVLTPERLAARLQGAAVDLNHSEPNCELKAVTRHATQVKKMTDGSWQATVIFDV